MFVDPNAIRIENAVTPPHVLVTVVAGVKYPADALWTIVGEFGRGDFGKGFVKRIDLEGDGSQVGAIRRLVPEPSIGQAPIVEMQTARDDRRRTMSYAVLDFGDLPWAGYEGSITVAGRGAAESVLIFDGKITPFECTYAAAASVSESNWRFYLNNLNEILENESTG